MPGAVPEQARRNHARIVDHDEFVAAKQVREFAEMAVLPRAGRAIEQQHPRGVALLERPLRDALRRQVEIKFAQVHAAWVPICNAPMLSAVAQHVQVC